MCTVIWCIKGMDKLTVEVTKNLYVKAIDDGCAVDTVCIYNYTERKLAAVLHVVKKYKIVNNQEMLYNKYEQLVLGTINARSRHDSLFYKSHFMGESFISNAALCLYDCDDTAYKSILASHSFDLQKKRHVFFIKQ